MPPHTREIRLQASEAAPARARQFVTRQLHIWGLTSLTEPCALVASELVTNSVHATARLPDHSHRLVIARCRRTPAALVFEAWDCSDEPPVPRTPEDTEAHGRGLLLVASSCQQWGFDTSPQVGKVVWAYWELPRGHYAALHEPVAIRLGE
jgi:anti-sigma regulatory factor (Ser/Thr protein kinase)